MYATHRQADQPYTEYMASKGTSKARCRKNIRHSAAIRRMLMTSEIRPRANGPDSGRFFGRGCGDVWGILSTIVMYSTTLTVASAVNFFAIPEFRHWRCIAIVYNCIVMLLLASHLQCMWTNPGIAKDFLDQGRVARCAEHRLHVPSTGQLHRNLERCGAMPDTGRFASADVFLVSFSLGKRWLGRFIGYSSAGADGVGGGHESFRFALQNQATHSLRSQQEAPVEEDDDWSEDSSIFQGQVPKVWLVSESGSSANISEQRGATADKSSSSASSGGGTKSQLAMAGTSRSSQAASASPFRSRPAQVEIFEHVTAEVRQRCLDILSNLPKDEAGRLTSLGSVLHEDGQCKPCAYWFKGLCKNGVACHNCHMVHEGQRPKRLRPSKQARMQLVKGDSSIPEEADVPQNVWKKAMAERAIPSAPGPVGQQTVELKVTTTALQQVCGEMDFKITQPAISTPGDWRSAKRIVPKRQPLMEGGGVADPRLELLCSFAKVAILLGSASHHKKNP
eukprot:s251_g26.t1